MSLNLLRVSLLAATLASLGACASGAKPEMMTLMSATASAKPAAATQPGYRAMGVQQVQGGNETNPMWASDVSNADFQKALEASLKAFDYLVMDGAMAKYRVTASIVDVQKPLMGLDFSVTMKVRYSVMTDQGATAFDDTIAATGTATMGEAFAGVERLRIAIEKAAKANIEAFLTRLATDLK
jgi:hypothetical protein